MIPKGTPLPSAASIVGLDKNEPDLCLMGAVLRFTRVENGRRLFMCEGPSGRYHKTLRGELPENQIELLDMPVDEWPEKGNVAP